MEAEGFGVIIEGFIWLTDVIDKIEAKHGLTVLEVESVFTGKPLFSRIEKGKIKGEDLYRALGRDYSGRLIAVFFIHKFSREALIITARDMTVNEKRYYAKKT